MKSPKMRKYPFKQQLTRKMSRIIFMLVAAVIASSISYFNNKKSPVDEPSSTNISQQRLQPGSNSNFKTFSDSDQQQAVAKIQAAKHQTNAQFWVGVNGKVIKLLKDDLKGSQHQKFLLSVAPDTTLLISHNIDLASRVPVNKGDSISLRGRYEWNNRGGAIHWTHHDPKGKKQGGWIQVNGKTYR
jgi:hypothetical protein